MGLLLVLISLAIWHQVQGPQKKEYTQSLQIVPCEDRELGLSVVRVQGYCIKYAQIQ